MKNEKKLIDMLSNFKQETRLTIDYDAEEDILYIHTCGKPIEADDATQIGDYIIRLKNQVVIGITLLNARANSRIQLVGVPPELPQALRDCRLVYA